MSGLANDRMVSMLAVPGAEHPDVDVALAHPFGTQVCGGLSRSGRGRYPARAGGPWLCSTLVLFLFHAVVVPSGLTTRVQPQRWITTW